MLVTLAKNLLSQVEFTYKNKTERSDVKIANVNSTKGLVLAKTLYILENEC